MSSPVLGFIFNDMSVLLIMFVAEDVWIGDVLGHCEVPALQRPAAAALLSVLPRLTTC